MAKPSVKLIEAIRRTAQNLKNGAPYQWGHMGCCNCGNLAQEITKLSRAEIHERAMKRKGDWNDQCDNFCPTSGIAMDDLISELLNAGLDIDDLKNLEDLSDKNILKTLPTGRRNLIKNKRDDVVIYLNAWAKILEKTLIDEIDLYSLLPENEVSVTDKT